MRGHTIAIEPNVIFLIRSHFYIVDIRALLNAQIINGTEHLSDAFILLVLYTLDKILKGIS